MNTRVMLVGRPCLILDGLKRLMESEPGIVVVGAADGQSAVELSVQLNPDVVLLDIDLPEESGCLVARQFRERTPDTRIVALATYCSPRSATALAQAGVWGWVSKRGQFRPILDAVRNVAAGRQHFGPDAGGFPPVNPQDPTRRKTQVARSLSAREEQVLRLVADGLCSKQVALQLEIAMKTVEHHRRSIMDKLQLRSIAQLTKYAVREGLTPLEPRAGVGSPRWREAAL